MDFFEDEQNESAKKQLIKTLKEKRSILMVGAGSSKYVDFPSWAELINKLHQELTPSLILPKDITLAEQADLVKDQLTNKGQENKYYIFLERIYRPKANNHNKFHCNLVKLGFCGIVTTNYDMVLETAISEAFSNESAYKYCEKIDLCLPIPKTYKVFEFLRSLSSNTEHNQVLHIHGCYDNAEYIILTQKDYLRGYGEMNTINHGQPLDTIHRKVIWALLTMYSLVFVGFSMQDEFFMKMLAIVQKDFSLEEDSVHYALMGFKTTQDKDRTSLLLKQKGVLPIFYYIPETSNSNEIQNYSNLEKLILELANSVGVLTHLNNVFSVTQKMMER